MADFTKIMQQAQQMQSRLQQMQDELQSKTVTAASGGGMVTVTAAGKGQVRKIQIDPSVVNASDVEMLEDLVLTGVKKAIEEGEALAQSEMGKLTAGMGLPPGLGF